MALYGGHGDPRRLHLLAYNPLRPGGPRAMSNERPTRRRFVGAAGAAMAGLAGAPWPAAAMQPPPAASTDPRDPDQVVFNAKGYTVDAAAPRAEAFAVKAGRFAAGGTTQGMRGTARN